MALWQLLYQRLANSGKFCGKAARRKKFLLESAPKITSPRALMPTFRLLLIEDDPLISSSLKLSLELQNFVVTHCDTFDAGLQCVQAGQCDLVVLDVGYPELDGARLLNEIRQCDPGMPILILTGNADVASMVIAIKAGADDYLRKPFRVDELNARIRRLFGKHTARQLRYGDLCIEVDKHLVWVDGQPLNLGKREFSILAALVARAGHVLTLSEIQGAIEQHVELYDRTVESYLTHLRKKLKGAGAIEVIVPVHDVGYQLELT